MLATHNMADEKTPARKNGGKANGAGSPAPSADSGSSRGPTSSTSASPRKRHAGLHPPFPSIPRLPRNPRSTGPAAPASLPAAIAPTVLPGGPKRQRFLFISKYGLIHDLAWEVKKEGQEVLYHIALKSERDVADGFVEKVDKWEECKDWADVIVFDDCEFGSLADKLRAEGKTVIGGTPYTDKLEMDRDFGQEEMKAAGITTLPTVGV